MAKLRSMHFSMPVSARQTADCLSAEQSQLSREREALVLSTMAGGIMGCYCEPGFPLYFMNSRMLQYLGYADESAFRADIHGLIQNSMHPDDRTAADRAIREQLAAGGQYAVDYRMRRQDGSYLWIHNIGKLGADEAGRRVIVSVCYDVTSDHAKQAQMENLVNAIPGGMALYRVVHGDLQLLYQSDGVSALTGRTPEEYACLVSRSVGDSIHPEDRPRFFAAIRQAVESDRPQSLDYRIPNKDGTFLWITGSLRRTGTDGGCPILHAVFTEIPQQRMLMSEITEHSGVFIIVTDQDTYELLYINHAVVSALHLKSGDYTGKKCYEYLLGRSTPCAFCKAMQCGRAAPSEQYIPELDRYYLAQGHRENWAGHRARIEYLTDITAEHRKKQELDNIINAIPGGVAIYKISDIFETVYFSDGVPQLSGYTVAEYHTLIRGDAAQMTHPDDREMVVRELRRACANNTTADFTFRKIHRDGHTVWVHVQGNKIGEDGGCPLIQCVFHNISAQKEQEFMNQHLLNSVAGGVILYEVVNGQPQIEQCSKGIAALSGHTPEEYLAVASDGFGIVYEPDVPMLRRAFERILQSGEAVQTSHHIRHKDGHLLGVHMNARMVGYKDGHPLICAVFMKMSNEADLYQTLAQKSSDGIYVISKKNHELLYMNAQAQTIFQLEDTDWVNRPCHEILRQCSAQCADCKVFDTDGEGRPYELYVSHLGQYFSCMPYSLDWAGIPAYVLYVSNVTSRKTAMQEITNIYNNIPGAVFRCRFDADWTVLSANDGLFRFLGYTRAEFAALGNKMSSVIYPEDLAVMTPKISAQLAGGQETVENENRLICKDGTVKWISIKAQLLKDSQGERYFYCVFVDISKQKADERQRIATEKNLTVAVSHMGIYYWEIIDFQKRIIRSNRMVRTEFDTDGICDNYPERFLSRGYVAQEDCEAYRQGVERIYQGAAYSQFDARIQTRKHGFTWMRLRITRIDEAGAPPRAVCTAEEIAEYKGLEQRINTVMQQNEISSWTYDIKRNRLLLGQSGFWPQGLTLPNPEISPDELVDKLHPDDVQPWLSLHERLTRGNCDEELRFRMRTDTDRTYHHLRCRYTLLPDRDGVPTYALGSCVDISEQVHQQERYETALRNRYSALGENVVLIGHCNITRDILLEMDDRSGLNLQKEFAQGRDGFFTALGTRIPDEAQRKTFYDATLSEPVSRDFQLGITQHDVTFMMFLDGGTHNLCWLSLHIDTVEQPDTKDLLGFLTITNITESKKQEQMLETVARRNYDYVAHVNLYEDSMTLYRHREMSEAETAYLTGQTYCLSAAMEDSLQRYVAPEDQALYKARTSLDALSAQLRDSDSYEFAFHMVECGVLRAKRMRIDVLDRRSGTAVMTRSDVTDVVAQQEQQKKQLSEALEIAESANRHKTEFLSSMSHDIRTPMNAIVGMCTLALENEHDEAQVHESLETIQSASQILLSLINNILDMSRIESGKMVLQDTPFSLLTQINKTAESYRGLTRQKHLRFQMHTNIRHDSCRGDISRIHSAVDNVLSNAIKYTPEGGTVTYRVSELPSDKPDIGLYRFEVSDTGIGITAEDQEHIFEPFYRGETERRFDIQGSGLGLPITKQIVELKGGTISVQSTPGAGSTFVIEMPLHLCSDSAVPSRKKQTPADTKHDFTGIHVLLCEDHPVNQRVVTRILEKVHAQVTLAANGQEGYRLFADSPNHTYQLILMDIRMPLMDGYEAATAIRSCGHPQAASIPIVALSANAFSEDVQKSMQHGMNAHIAKPVMPAQIYETMETFCGNHRTGPAAKQKVLFVDDAEINIAVLTVNLQDQYEVFVARNGEEAINTLEQNPDIAAVITDLQMPEMDGITLIKTIRANHRYQHVTVLANTQYGGVQQEELLRKIGADDFLYKPTTPEVVERRLRMALQAHGGPCGPEAE